MSGGRSSELHLLVEAVAATAPPLNPDQQRVAIALYRHLAQGEPVSTRSPAADLGHPQAEVDAMLSRWPGLARTTDGRISSFCGLAIPETSHRFRLAGRKLHTWCAWDALFLPELIGRTAEVDSRSPLSAERVRLTVEPRRIREAQPPDAVVSILEPRKCCGEGAVGSFCRHSHFFASLADARPWLEERQGAFALPLDEGVELAHLVNRRTYPDVLARKAAHS